MKPEEQLKGQSIQTVSAQETVREQDKIHCFLSYFGIFSLIPLLTVKDSNFIQWHAKQGITVFAAMVAIAIVGSVLSGVIPFVGLIFGCAFALLNLGLLVADIIAMVKAFGGERWRIPVIAGFAEKF